MRVNKRELRQILACSPPTLDSWIAQHGSAFPVLERGGNGRDWWFDAEAVLEFLDQHRAEKDRLASERDAAINQLALPLGHNGGPELNGRDECLRPHELLTMAKVRKLQREEEYACGLLVRRSEVEGEIGSTMRLLRDLLLAVPRRVGDRHAWSNDLVHELRSEIQAAMDHCVSILKGSLKRDGGPELDFGPETRQAAE